MVGGYLLGPRHLRTLILGQYDREGKFVYAGICGTGLSQDTRAVILEELKATRRKTCPSPTAPVLRDDFHELPDTLAQPLHDWQNFYLLAGGAAELAGVVCGTGFRRV